MKDTSRILDLKYKLQTIELLNLAKTEYTYRALSGILHLPETVLSRYVKGHVLPTAERAEEINKTLQKYGTRERASQENKIRRPRILRQHRNNQRHNAARARGPAGRRRIRREENQQGHDRGSRRSTPRHTTRAAPRQETHHSKTEP